MTAGANVNYWLRADITLKNKNDLSTTTISFTNRNVISTTNTSYFPLLWDLSQLGADMDQYLPQPITGSISLIDNYDSFGVERKLSDLLDRYIVQDQPIEIFYAANKVDDLDPSSWTSIFKGFLQTWERSSLGKIQLIDIAIEQRPWKRKYLGQLISGESIVFDGVEVENLGLVVPVVLGDGAEVRPLLISEYTGAPNPYHEFAYATNLHTTFINGNPSAYFALDHVGNWEEFTSTSSSFEVTSNSYGSASIQDGLSTNEYAVPIGGGSGKLITGGYFKIAFGATGAPTGTITINLYGSDNAGLGPQYLLASANVQKANFPAGVSSFTFTFDKPVLDNVQALYLGIKDFSPDATSRCKYVYSSSTAVYRAIASSANGSGWYLTAAPFPEWKLYGVYVTTPALSGGNTDINGFNPSTILLNQITPDTSQPIMDFASYNFICSVSGLQDDTSGTISGTPSLTLVKPHHVMQLLSYDWNGSAWVTNANWDHTTFSSTHSVFSDVNGLYYRQIFGAVPNQATLEDLVSELCRNSACRIGLSNSGKLGLWAWGTTLTAQKTFTQENGRIRRVFIEDATFVVNKLTMRYSPLLRNSARYSTYRGINELGYSGGKEKYDGQNALSDELIGNSALLYGERFLEQNTFDYIVKEVSIELLARFFLVRYNSPSVLIELEVPFQTNDTLKLLDVINLQYAELPQYYGTSPNALLPNVSGLPIDLAQGYTYTRAPFYRGQIESRKINFSQQDKEPSLSFRVRLLQNYPKDPT